MVRLSLSPSTSLFLEARECGRHKYWPQSFFGRAVSAFAYLMSRLRGSVIIFTCSPTAWRCGLLIHRRLRRLVVADDASIALAYARASDTFIRASPTVKRT